MSTASLHPTLLEAHAQAPVGTRFYASPEEIASDPSLSPYTHLLIRAWHDFSLAGVVCVAGIPTLYLCCFEQPLKPEEAANYQRRFWNQGIATVLVLADSQNVSLYSGLATPTEQGEKELPNNSLIETVTLAEYAFRIREFYFQLATGQFYKKFARKFDSRQSVDTYLLDNLGAIRDALATGPDGLDKSAAHTFLARILFTCYLIDRGIIDLAHYPYCDCSQGAKLVDVLEPLEQAAGRSLLYRLFDDLKEKFNGSMFEQSTEAEQDCLKNHHVELLIKFLRGHKVKTKQLSLGFWAYDFQWIPVETISAIYEDFLANEDREGKQQAGAFYTPRFLAETVLDVAVQGDDSWETKRYLDPACGSGIFLVALFNRLATRWLVKNPNCTYEAKAAALLAVMRDQLCGFDINPTACRIACFSLYLAFLDRFDPPDFVGYVERTGNKLPKILLTDEFGVVVPDFPVIIREDFLNPSRFLESRFAYIVGNPPWQGRGSKQIAHHFAQQIPNYLEPKGKACILLPSKVLFNQTANKFQLQWLQSVMLEKVVQLADYRFILFKNAICPSIIARFTAAIPDIAHHVVDYETPKVRRIDLREGIIPIAPGDRKRIPLRELLHGAREQKAPIIWKQHLWGTSRDCAFLRHLFEMPQLRDSVDVLSEIRKSKSAQSKRWVIGQGFKPYKLGKIPQDRPLVSFDWQMNELFVSPADIKGKLFPQPWECRQLASHLSEGAYYTDRLYSKPPEDLFTPPFILINQGFTNCSYFDFPVRFQDSLQSIAGQPEDEDLLLFLTFYLRSKLARYFLFHTAANWGTERDKVHLDELLRLPFPLPGSEEVSPEAEEIVRAVADRARRLKENIKLELNPRISTNELMLSGYIQQALAVHHEKVVNGLQAEIEPLVYKYFDLIDQEIMLVEDTVEVFIKSATPPRIDSDVPTLKPIHKNSLTTYKAGLRVYAETLADTLNEWATQASGTIRVSPGGGVDERAGLAMVNLHQASRQYSFRPEKISAGLADVLVHLQEAICQSAGRLDYLRGIIWFDDNRIRIIKPDTVEYWTKTAALNDAAEIYARIAQARQASKRN